MSMTTPIIGILVWVVLLSTFRGAASTTETEEEEADESYDDEGMPPLTADDEFNLKRI